MSQLTRLRLSSLSGGLHGLSDSYDGSTEACHGDTSGTLTAMGKHECVHLLLQLFGNLVAASHGHASSLRVLFHLTHEVSELLLVEHAILVGVSSTEGSSHLGHPFRLDWVLSGSSAISGNLILVLLGEGSTPFASPGYNSIKVFGHLASLFFQYLIMTHHNLK